MSDTLCLRCDWTGEADGDECPRCGAPLYRMHRPDAPTRERVARPAPPASSAGRPVRAPAARGARPSQPEPEPPPEVETGSRGRVAVIVVAFALVAASFALGPLRGTAPDRDDGTAEARADPATPTAEPSLRATPSPPPDDPGPCLQGPSPGAAEPADEAPTPVADYRFQGSLTSDVAGVPDLVEAGHGRLAYSDEGVIGRTVLTFAEGAGLELPAAGLLIGGEEYTIEIVFRFDRVDGYRKVVDFKHGTTDDGVYLFDGCMTFFPRTPDASFQVEADEYVQVVLARDALTTVIGYVDGERQFVFTDTDGLAVLDGEAILRFFLDDETTAREASGGAVSQIRLYDRAITPGEVTALACAELRVPLAPDSC